MEICEVFLSELERTNRIDSEFYRKETFAILEQLNKNKTEMLTKFVSVSDGNHMGMRENFQNKGIPYYRGQDIHSFFIENSNPIYIDTDTFNLPYMKRSHLKKRDILLSIVGTIGKVAIVTTNQEATCNCKLAILRQNEQMQPEYIAIYLKSKYGYNQIEKFKRGTVQMGYLLEDINQIVIPIVSQNFQQKIENIVMNSNNMIKKSKLLYEEAENILNKELGFENYKENKENNYVKSFSQSFGLSGRLDAEYYQKKYDDLFSILKNFNCEYLYEIVRIKKSIEPGSEYYTNDGVPFVRISDINKYEIRDPDIKLPKSIFGNASYLFPKKDTILLSKDGSIGIAYKVDKDENFITSSALLHLKIVNIENIIPDYLTLILNSKIVQLQAERDSGGSIIKHWKLSEINKVIIPVLDKNIQEEIAKKVENSFYYRRQSKKLLDIAVKMVEIAIEEGEEKALKHFEMSAIL